MCAEILERTISARQSWPPGSLPTSPPPLPPPPRPAGVDGLIAAKAADLKKLLVGTMTEERIRLRQVDVAVAWGRPQRW